MNELEKVSDDKIELLKKTVCIGATDAELALFLHVCQQTGLDPFTRQIYSIKRGNQRTIQTGIDGLRSIAERTGKYSPGKETTFVYDENKRLVSATAYIKKMTPDGTWHEIGSTAFYSEYNQGQGLWGRMPTVMLTKCAESNALRRAFPQEMCGLYSDDEMPPQGKEEVEIKVQVVEEPSISLEQLTELMKIIGDNKNNKELSGKIKENLASKGKDKISFLKVSEFAKFKEDLENWIKEINRMVP